MVHGSTDEDVEQVYAGYEEWKSWAIADFMQVGPSQRNYYADELRGTPIRGRDVLEIGFGSGSFLAWARDEGAQLYGTEALPAARKQAAANGVTILPLDLAESLPQRERKFAAILAFDVMEHLTYDQNRTLLDQVAALLADDGVFVARYPNGQSPFGRAHQHGDMTHRCVLSAGVMQQLLAGRPFAIEHLGNQAPARASGLRRVGSAVRNLLQRAVEGGIRRIYGADTPLGPNAVAVLRRLPR